MSDPKDYTIGWICAVRTELVAAQEMLDEEHDDVTHREHNDNNIYTLGRIGKHNVVIAGLPHWQYGIANAAAVARDMVHSFPNVRIGIMVGIGGGAPKRHDIRLGDIVVTSAGYGNGGIFQYDYGKTVQDGSFEATGYLNQPPQLLLSAIASLEALHERKGHKIEETINGILTKNPRLTQKYQRPDSITDKLYKSSFKHAGSDDENCASVCNDTSELVARTERSKEQDNPMIHYGLIASANQLMKDASIRDKLSDERDVLCFEMEAAGLMNHFPCLVIRGICDYSDSHKNVNWQGYAAMAAAAYAKELLGTIVPSRVEAEKKLSDVLNEISTKLDSVHSLASDAQTGVENLQANKHLDDIRKWLGAPDPSTNFNKAISDRHPNSGQWLLKSKAYSTWKMQQNSFLWLYGIPGCGKTILSSTIVEDLQKNETSSSILLYFYFDFTDASKQYFENALRSLTIQLYHKSKGVRGLLDSLYSSCADGRNQPGIEALHTTLLNMIQQAGEVWVVLDALDECQTRSEDKPWGLLPWIQCFRNSQMNCHILVTSRPEQDIESDIRSYNREQDIIPIQSSSIQDDIRHYVTSRVRKHKGLSRWETRPDIQTKIENTLLDKANGMFRWVSCQLDALKNCLDPITLDRALESLPKDLDETYARILKSLPSEYAHHTIRLLQFLTYSERPLRIEEAVDAITVDEGKKPRFDPGNRMPVPGEIVRYCSSLAVRVERIDKDTRATVVEIQLAHFSVKDYLTSQRPEEHIAQHFKETVAHSCIAKVYLIYLCELNQDLSITEIRQSFFLAQCAARYWASHALVAERDSQMDMEIITEFFSSSEAYTICSRLYRPEYPWDKEPEDVPTRYVPPALYYASLVGLSRSVKLLLDKGADINAQGRYGTALQRASEGGHEQVVKLLLNKGADINARSIYGTALQVASEGGHEQVVKLLLNKGADVNAQGGRYGTALQAASANGHEQVVKLLLNKGANINNARSIYGTALQAASANGHDRIVKLLQDNQAGMLTKTSNVTMAIESRVITD